MKLLKFANKSLMLLVTDTAVMKSPSASGSSVTIAVDDNKNISQNDFILIGEIGQPKSEIAQVSAVVTLGTAIQLDTLTFPHNAGTPVYRIPYNQVKFYRAATLAGVKSLLASGTITIDAQNEYTTYTDTTNTTGYLFFTLYNSFNTTESGYSAGFNYETIPYGSRIKIREFVTSKHNWDKELDEATFNALCDFAESEIFAIRRWRFREKSVSFSSVANQQAYTRIVAGATDMGQLVYATYDGNPVTPIDIKRHQNLNWNVLTTGTARRVWEWNGSLYFTPIPSEIKTIVLYYFKDSSGFSDETVESDVQLPQAIAFRILQDLWSMADMQKSQYFERRYLQTIAAMKVNDIKQVSHFPTLSDNRLDKLAIYDQVDNPTITI